MIKAFAALESGGKLAPYTYDPGELNELDVEIAVEYCGICHSDLSMINNEWGMTTYPVVAGHEIVGKIAKLGNQVKSLKIGQTVGLGWHCGYCDQCEYCKQGDHNLCANAQATIIHHGGFADKVRARANSVVAIPESLEIEAVGPLFCGGITVFNPLAEYNISPTAKVGVIGIGGLGHMAIKFLRAWGCEVTAFSSKPEKERSILEMGAHRVLNSTDESAIQAASSSFDLIISTVNVKMDWNLYLNTLKPRGRLHFVGVLSDPLDIHVFGLLAAQRSISASPVGSPALIGKMLEFARVHNIKPDVEVFPMENINEAISHLKSGNARYRVVLKN